MSLFDFRRALELRDADYPIYSLLMAAMLKADTMNSARLRRAYPELWNELQARYDAPGGYLPGDVAHLVEEKKP